MALEIKTQQVVVLCATKDANDQFKVLKDHEVFGGILLKLEHSLIGHQQIQQELVKRTKANHNQVILVEALTPTISINKEPATVVLSIIPPFAKVDTNQWTTLPEIIRNLPQDKTRVPYVKVLQILAGGLESDLSAVEMTQEIIDKLKQDLDSPD